MPGLHSLGGSSGTCQLLLQQIQPHLLPKLHHVEANKPLPPLRDLSWQTPCTQQGLLTKAASAAWGGTGLRSPSTGVVTLHLWLPTCLLTTQILCSFERGASLIPFFLPTCLLEGISPQEKPVDCRKKPHRIATGWFSADTQLSVQ